MARNYKMIAGLVLAVLFLCAGMASAQQTLACNALTVKGTYGIQLNVSYPGLGAWATAVGTMTFDGVAGWSSTAVTNWNGTVFPPSTVTGSYQVNHDCTGSVAYTWEGVPSTMYFVIVDNGKQILAIESGPGPVAYVGIRL